jgi:hypothetical protein
VTTTAVIVFPTTHRNTPNSNAGDIATSTRYVSAGWHDTGGLAEETLTALVRYRFNHAVLNRYVIRIIPGFILRGLIVRDCSLVFFLAISQPPPIYPIHNIYIALEKVKVPALRILTVFGQTGVGIFDVPKGVEARVVAGHSSLDIVGCQHRALSVVEKLVWFFCRDPPIPKAGFGVVKLPHLVPNPATGFLYDQHNVTILLQTVTIKILLLTLRRDG